MLVTHGQSYAGQQLKAASSFLLEKHAEVLKHVDVDVFLEEKKPICMPSVSQKITSQS